MRTAFKRIFRRKKDKRRGRGNRQTTDDTTPDEPASAPVSLFQPAQPSHGRRNNNLSSSVVSDPGTPTRSTQNKVFRESKAKSSTVSSIIAPIREEFDQISVASSKLSPTAPRETKRAPATIASETMKAPLNAPSEDTAPAVAETPPYAIASNYESIPVLAQTKLPRGGVSVDTKAVGRVQVRYDTV